MEKAGASRKKKILMAVSVVLVVVIAGGAGVVVRWMQDGGNSSKDPRTTTRSGVSEEIDELQDLRAAGDTEAAKQKIDEGLNSNSTSDKERYLLYIQQGNIFATDQNFVSAIESYKKAEAIQQTFEIISLLGNTYQSAGDKEKAIEYFKRAIPLVPESPLQGDEQESLKQKIINLGGTP